METIHIAIVDDHQLFRSGLKSVIEEIDERFHVVAEASNGRQFLDKLDEGLHIDVVVMDVNMPIMDGFQTLEELKNYKKIPGVLSLTMLDDDLTLIRLLKLGTNGFLNKDVDPFELSKAILTIAKEGQYFSAAVAGKLVGVIKEGTKDSSTRYELSDREQEFLKLASSELTYAEIAEKMSVSPKTVDNYRVSTFQKLDAKTRIGLVLAGLKLGLVEL